MSDMIRRLLTWLRIRRVRQGCEFCGGQDHGTYQHRIGMEEMRPGEVVRGRAK